MPFPGLPGALCMPGCNRVELSAGAGKIPFGGVSECPQMIEKNWFFAIFVF